MNILEHAVVWYGTNNGIISNVSIYGYAYQNRSCLGGIAGYNNGEITKCKNYAELKIRDGYSDNMGVGGICAKNSEKGIVTYCKNFGKISSAWYSAGIVARNYGEISKCGNEGIINPLLQAAGIVVVNNGTVEQCYNNANVRANQQVAGGIAVNNSANRNNKKLL